MQPGEGQGAGGLSVTSGEPVSRDLRHGAAFSVDAECRKAGRKGNEREELHQMSDWPSEQALRLEMTGLRYWEGKFKKRNTVRTPS